MESVTKLSFAPTDGFQFFGFESESNDSGTLLSLGLVLYNPPALTA